MTELVYLSLLIVVSLPFAGVAALVGRLWTVALPVGFWLLVVALQNQGIVPGDTNIGSAIFAGLVGAAFAWAGYHLRTRTLRSAAE